jgi:hypothetical protein
MTKRQTIAAWAAALAALAVVGLLAGCSVERRSDSTIFRFLTDPPAPAESKDDANGFPWGPVGIPAPDANEYQ